MTLGCFRAPGFSGLFGRYGFGRGVLAPLRIARADFAVFGHFRPFWGQYRVEYRVFDLGHRLKWGRNIDLRTLICPFWVIIGRLG